MSPARIQDIAGGKQMSRERSFNYLEGKSHSSRSPHYPGSYPGALSESAQVPRDGGGASSSENTAISTDEISGNISSDELSSALNDSRIDSGSLCLQHELVHSGGSQHAAVTDDMDDQVWISETKTHVLKRPIEIKLCIEKEYVHVINIDHSRLAEELERRNSGVASLHGCGGIDRVLQQMPSPDRTPGMTSRSTVKKLLTGESIRKLFKIMSPSSRRRHHHRSAELRHSSGSSVSGDTVTGSKSSLTGDGELPSNVAIGQNVELTKRSLSAESGRRVACKLERDPHSSASTS